MNKRKREEQLDARLVELETRAMQLRQAIQGGNSAGTPSMHCAVVEKLWNKDKSHHLWPAGTKRGTIWGDPYLGVSPTGNEPFPTWQEYNELQDYIDSGAPLPLVRLDLDCLRPDLRHGLLGELVAAATPFDDTGAMWSGIKKVKQALQLTDTMHQAYLQAVQFVRDLISEQVGVPAYKEAEAHAKAFPLTALPPIEQEAAPATAPEPVKKKLRARRKP